MDQTMKSHDSAKTYHNDLFDRARDYEMTPVAARILVATTRPYKPADSDLPRMGLVLVVEELDSRRKSEVLIESTDTVKELASAFGITKGYGSTFLRQFNDRSIVAYKDSATQNPVEIAPPKKADFTL